MEKIITISLAALLPILLISGIIYVLNSDDVSSGGIRKQSGTFSASVVEANSVRITADTSGASSLGQGVIHKGEKQVRIITSATESTSHVFVTARSVTTQALAVIEIVPGNSFTVALHDAATEDVMFDWMIVGSK
jgi:hypothetical protein